MKSLNTKLKTLFWLAAVSALFPIVSHAQERIAFQTNRDGNYEVYSMKADGSNPLRLTTNSAFDGEPSFGNGGSKIVFTSTRDGNAEIYTMNPDGTGQKRVTTSLGDDVHPALSPDGSKIAFISARAGGLELFVMNADGSNPTQLTFTSWSEFSPSFSPDGTKILYSAYDGNDSEIWSINPDGSGNTNLTDNSADDRDASFSPDGSKIVYQVYYQNDWEIFTMNADGTDQTNISNTPAVNDEGASYSPDGNHIVYACNGEICAMTYGGAGKTNLTNLPSAADFNATWSAANSAPALENLSIAPVNEGGTATLTGTISDANAGDSFTLIVSWGEGGAPDEIELPAGTTSFEVTHVYKDDTIINTSSDDFQVILNVNDHRFGVDIEETAATVNNLDPTLSDLALTPSTVTVGTAFRLRGNFADAGYHGSVTDEALTVTISFGDGQTNISPNSTPGLIDIFHTYAAVGNYTITVKVTDNDLGETIQTIPVTVAPPAPPVAPTDFRVDYIGANRIQLAWTDASNNEDGFVIERCSSRGCNNFIQVGQTAANATVYLDSNLFSNTQYYYRMRAFNLGGSSEYTSVVSAKTLRK